MTGGIVDPPEDIAGVITKARPGIVQIPEKAKGTAGEVKSDMDAGRDYAKKILDKLEKIRFDADPKILKIFPKP